jgi:uncharacterized FlaG/YvyC family protein
MAGVSGVELTRQHLPEQVGPKPPAVQRAVEAAASGLPGGVRLRVYQPTGRVYAEIIDPQTREVVKTVPPLELLKVTAQLQKTLGLLIDKTG